MSVLLYVSSDCRFYWHLLRSLSYLCIIESPAYLRYWLVTICSRAESCEADNNLIGPCFVGMSQTGRFYITLYCITTQLGMVWPKITSSLKQLTPKYVESFKIRVIWDHPWHHCATQPHRKGLSLSHVKSSVWGRRLKRRKKSLTPQWRPAACMVISARQITWKEITLPVAPLTSHQQPQFSLNLWTTGFMAEEHWTLKPVAAKV